MRANPCFLALALLVSLPVFALPAFAQSAPGTAAVVASCVDEQAILESDIDAARAKGQMLRRQRLMAALTLVEARCGTEGPAPTLAAQIDAHEQAVRELRQELERAEAQLRLLKNEAS